MVCFRSIIRFYLMVESLLIFCLEFKQNKRCTENEMFVIGLNPRTEYSVRVFAIRSCDEGDIPGVYSPSKIFTTPSSHDADLGDTQKNLSMEVWFKKLCLHETPVPILWFIFRCLINRRSH